MEDGTSKSLGYCGDTGGDHDVVLQWDTCEDSDVPADLLAERDEIARNALTSSR